MARKILSIVLALTLAFGVFTVAASAATIEATAGSFVNDFKTAADGDVVVLTEDVTLTALCTTKAAITLDLNGHEITSTASYALICDGDNGDLTIIDSVGGGAINGSCAVQIQNRAKGTIEAGTFNGTVKCVGDTFKTASYLTIEGGTFNGTTALNSLREGKIIVNDAVVNGDVFLQTQGNVEVNGGKFTSPSYCFVTNGTDSSNNTIVINDGTFTATNATGAAIYFPTKNSITINGGTFTGAAAIYQKSGTTIINGGEFYATGAQAAYHYYGNGFYTTGDAIIADSCGYKGGAPIVRIYGGEFYSENGASVKGYTYNNNVPPVIAIYDGIFEDDAAETYPGKAVYNLTTATGYDTFAAAAQAASEGDTIGLFEDVVVGAYTAVTDVTIDLFGNDITSEGNAPLDAFGTVTVIDSFGGGKIAGAQRGIWVNKGATLTVDAAEVDGVVVEGTATLKNAYIDGYVATLSGATVNVTSTGTVVTGDMDINDSTLTINNGTFNKVFVHEGSTATIKNGKYNLFSAYGDDTTATIKNGTFVNFYSSKGATATITKGTFNGQTEVYDGGTLVIDGGTFKDQIVPCGGWPVKGDADATAAKAEYVTTLTINGGTFTDDSYNVAGNGTDVATTIITINGGNFEVSKSGTNIFHPMRGTLTINGGTFQGGDCIYQKSGNVIINDGTFRAVGLYADFAHTGNGFNQTGETIVIESCNYPGGAPSLRINGGLFYSRNNDIISYYYTEGNELASTGFVYGGQFEKAVAPEFWANSNAFTLLNIEGGTASIIDEQDSHKILITADQGEYIVRVFSNAADVGSKVTFSDLMGGCRLSAGNQVYTRSSGSFKATIGEDVYDVTVVFQHFDVEDCLVVDNATIEVEDYTVTLHAIDSSKMVTVSHGTVYGTEVTFDNLTGAAKVSKSKTLYAIGDGTAEIDVPNSGVYTVVFDFTEEQVAIEDTLRTTNATVEISGNTITLVPVDDSAKVTFINKTTDGKDVVFSNIVDAKTSKNGTLYSDAYATATATIDGTSYFVVFDFEVEEVPFAEMLRTTNATVTVVGTTITLTPVDSSANVSFINKLTDGTAVEFSELAGAAKTSKNGTLYAKNYATAVATIGGIDYDVVFDCPAEAGPSVAEIIKVTGANVEVSGTNITLSATGTQINVYKTCLDGSIATFSNLDGAKVSKAGTLYAKGDATATVTIGGTDYNVVFEF